MRDIAEQLGFDPMVALDDKLPGFELSTFTSYIDQYTMFVVAFGNNSFRLIWCDRIIAKGDKLAILINSMAYVNPSAGVMKEPVIFPKTIVNIGAIIHRGCIVNR